jgi:hypothetical protein
MSRPSPIAAQLISLQISDRPEDAEELAFLESYMAWVAAGGVKAYDCKRDAERHRQSLNNYRLRVHAAKKM